jgi:hypothetical protein
MRLRTVLILLVISFYCVAVSAAPITNADIVKMVEANVPATVIVQTISNSTDVLFDVNPAAVIELTRLSVPEAVISAMVARSATRQPAPTPATPSGPTVRISLARAPGAEFGLVFPAVEGVGGVGALFVLDAATPDAALAALNQGEKFDGGYVIGSQKTTAASWPALQLMEDDSLVTIPVTPGPHKLRAYLLWKDEETYKVITFPYLMGNNRGNIGVFENLKPKFPVRLVAEHDFVAKSDGNRDIRLVAKTQVKHHKVLGFLGAHIEYSPFITFE